MRKQPTGALKPYDFSAEAGDRVYQWIEYQKFAHIYELRESTGRNKRDAGELTPHIVKKNGKARRAIRDNRGVWCWDSLEHNRNYDNLTKVNTYRGGKA